MLHEAEKTLGCVTVRAPVGDLAIRNVQRCVQVDDAVTLVVVRVAFDFQRYVGTRFSPGVEIAVGLNRLRLAGEFGFRTELRIGYEDVPNSALNKLNSRVVVGGVFPVRFL
jgi:hypothetical protein